MRLQIVSDLHLETYPKETFEFFFEKEPSAPALALLGDIAPHDHPNLPRFLEWCSERWETIFYVPGVEELVHEAYTIDECAGRMRALCSKYPRVHFMYRDAFFTDDGAILLGCPLWSCLATQPAEIRARHRADMDWIFRTVKEYTNPFIILTHYGPTTWVQKSDVLGDPALCMSIPETELLLRKPIVVWAFGHYHGGLEYAKAWSTANGIPRSVLLVCNGFGPFNPKARILPFELGFRRDAVLRVDPNTYYRQEAGQ